MFKILAASLLFLLQGSPGSVPDPNSLAVPAPYIAGDPTPNFFPDWNNTIGKQQVPCQAPAGSVIETIVAIGQSDITNVTDHLYTTTNTAGVVNFNVGDGACYIGKAGGPIDPLLGCTGYAPNLPSPWPNGNWIAILADLIINAGKATRVNIVPIGVGGSYIHDWEPGGADNIRIGVTARRLAYAGLVPTKVLIGQGESDLFTAGPVYQASLQATINSIHSYWPNVDIYVAQETWIHGMTSPAVAAAQLAVINPSAHVHGGPNGDSRGAPYRQSDNTHWNYSPGALTWAADWNAVLPRRRQKRSGPHRLGYGRRSYRNRGERWQTRNLATN